MSEKTLNGFKVNAFPARNALAQDEQPFFWRAEMSSQRTVLHFNLGIASSWVQPERLDLGLSVEGAQHSPRVWRLKASSGSAHNIRTKFPREDVEASLRPHTDHIMVALLVSAIEEQAEMLWAGMVKSREELESWGSHDSIIPAWVQSHSGIVALGQQQWRSPEDDAIIQSFVGRV